MPYNLFVAYDLIDAGLARYQEMEHVISGLGTAVKVQKSLFYVSTQHSPSQASAILERVIRNGEKLAVIHATTAVLEGVDDKLLAAINNAWG